MKCSTCDSELPVDGSPCAQCEEDEDLLGSPPADDSRFVSVLLCMAITVVMVGGCWITYTSWLRGHPTAASAAVSYPPTVPPTPTPTPTASEGNEAADMNTLLQAIVATRSGISNTLGSCSTVGTDLTSIQQAVQDRGSQATQAANLQADQLTDGVALKQALVDMTQSALAADQDYLNWAQTAQSSGSCTDIGATGPIADANQKAANAKRGFVGLWNTDAGPLGEPTYVWSDF